MEQKLPYIEIDQDLCKGCSRCIEECKPQVIMMSGHFNGLGYQTAIYKGAGCTGCDACYYACPEPGVITVVKELRERPEQPKVTPKDPT